MYTFRQQFIVCLSALLLLICLAQSYRINEVEQNKSEDNLANDQPLTAAQLQTLNQLMLRRSLYDPAFGDSWSNYFEKKRSLFDPAYGDWANSFKRSDE